MADAKKTVFVQLEKPMCDSIDCVEYEFADVEIADCTGYLTLFDKQGYCTAYIQHIEVEMKLLLLRLFLYP